PAATGGQHKCGREAVKSQAALIIGAALSTEPPPQAARAEIDTLPMLQANSLECVRGERRLFHDLDFSLRAGGLLRVEGPNGSGKTSLLRMLCGLLTPAAGKLQ